MSDPLEKPLVGEKKEERKENTDFDVENEKKGIVTDLNTSNLTGKHHKLIHDNEFNSLEETDNAL